ncbi:MAG: hypothetical protein ACPG4T_23885 [Nannocystaceae bacterium]
MSGFGTGARGRYRHPIKTLELFGLQPEMTVVEINGAPSVDPVVRFRNAYIGWRSKTEADIMGALRPSGRFGLVTHQAAEGISLKQAASSKGCIPELHVVETVGTAGSDLVDHSEISASAKDCREGIWALSPVLAGSEKNREKLLDLGGSDRMTLVFRNPPDIAGAAAKAQEASKQAKEKFDNAAAKAEDAVKDAAKKGKKHSTIRRAQRRMLARSPARSNPRAPSDPSVHFYRTS